MQYQVTVHTDECADKYFCDERIVAISLAMNALTYSSDVTCVVICDPTGKRVQWDAI